MHAMKKVILITGASRDNFPFNTFNEKMWFFESNSTTRDANGDIDPNGATDLAAQGLA